jgi:hypothetical protein
MDALVEQEAINVLAIVAVVKDLPITGQKELDQLAGAAVQAKQRATWLEAEQRRLTKPHQAETKRIQDLFRAPREAYETLRYAIRERLERHQVEVRRAQEAAQLAAAAEFQRAQAAAQVLAAPAPAPVQAAAIETYREAAQAGHAALAAAPPPVTAEGLSFRRSIAFEILDPASVPRELCSPDHVKIRAWIKAGGREAAGLRVFQDESLAVRG